MLSDLFAVHGRVVADIPTDFIRYLSDRINWKHRLIGIVGARGSGKTTLVLQHYKRKYDSVEKCLYLSADNPLILKTGLYESVDEYFKYYGECVIIDEVHKYPDWSQAVKALYDSYPGKQFIILGSSMVNILHERGDLSRRMLTYTLKGLSFREYLNVTYGQHWTAYPFENIVQDHLSISRKLTRVHSTILRDFETYCTTGYFPFFLSCAPNDYLQLLAAVIEKVIYEDIPSTRPLQTLSSLKMKKLLAFLSMSTIPTLSTASLTNELDVSRDTLYEFLDLLQRAELATVVAMANKNVRSIKKSKILLNNPNLYYAISSGLWQSSVERGNLRESFFSSQVSHIHPLHTSECVDFSLCGQKCRYEIEIGGPDKCMKQLAGLQNGLLFKDGAEHGAGPQIPLYLAGFLY
ncbi:MAG: AAA family ATPase [Lentisphaeria bacterium]|nr:AAA family ATPase [Lentisphaeria bacterium]